MRSAIDDLRKVQPEPEPKPPENLPSNFVVVMSLVLDQWARLFTIPYAISISGRLNVPALDRSMKEILREPFSNIDGHSISTDR